MSTKATRSRPVTTGRTYGRWATRMPSAAEERVFIRPGREMVRAKVAEAGASVMVGVVQGASANMRQPVLRRHVPLPLVAVMIMLAALLWVPLTGGTASATYPGANGQIAFTRSNQVYTISPSRTGLVRLTSAAKNYWPRWSPNGRRIQARWSSQRRQAVCVPGHQPPACSTWTAGADRSNVPREGGRRSCRRGPLRRGPEARTAPSRVFTDTASTRLLGAG